MPKDYAKRLAAMLIHDHEEKITVDVPNDGFSDRVADELLLLGFHVDRDTLRKDRLTIIRKTQSS